MFERMARAMQQPGLTQDPRFVTRAERVREREAIEALTSTWVAARSASEIVAVLEQAGVPCALVATLDEVLDNEQLRHRGQITEVMHQSGEKVTMQGVTIHLSDTPLRIRSAIPYVGEHSGQVLSSWLGYSPQRLQTLADEGVISQFTPGRKNAC